MMERQTHPKAHFAFGEKRALAVLIIRVSKSRGRLTQKINGIEAMARRFGHSPFKKAGTILSCVCFAAALAAPAAIARASPIAIVSKHRDGSDVFTKVVGALCEKNKGEDDEREEDEQRFCRHFEDEHEVSSLLTQNVEAFDAIVIEVRGA